MDLRTIPGLLDALATEARIREDAFSGLPVPVCGVDIRPLTLRDYERLLGQRSPFLVGGLPDRGDVAVLLWHQRWDTSAEDDPARFAARFDSVALATLSEAVGQFIAEALMDAPTGGKSSTAPVVGLSASIVHRMCSTYQGMSIENVRDMPCAVLWQFLRCIQRDNDPQTAFFNALSDRVKGNYLRDLNQPTSDGGTAPPPPETSTEESNQPQQPTQNTDATNH